MGESWETMEVGGTDKFHRCFVGNTAGIMGFNNEIPTIIDNYGL